MYTTVRVVLVQGGAVPRTARPHEPARRDDARWAEASLPRACPAESRPHELSTTCNMSAAASEMQANAKEAKQKRYDRQLRLWGEHGQEAMEDCSVCLLNASATGSETLKNLVLPGARHARPGPLAAARLTRSPWQASAPSPSLTAPR